MSHPNFQEAILKLAKDKEYRDKVQTDPDKMKEDFNLSDSQVSVFFIDDLSKKTMDPTAERLTCCCC